MIGLATTCGVFTNRWWNCFPRFHSDFHCLRGPWVIFVGIRTNKVLNSVEKSLYRFRWSWSCTFCRHSGFCPLSRRGRYRHQGWLLLLCCTPDHKSYQSVHRQHKHHCHHCHHCHHFHPYHQFLIIITVSAPLFSNSRVASKAPSGPTSSAPDYQDEDQKNEEEENDDVEQTCHKGRLVCNLQPNIALARIVFAEVDGEVRFLKLTKLSLHCLSYISIQTWGLRLTEAVW